MVKRSTIGSVLVAAALGLAAFLIIRKPRLDVPSSSFQSTFTAPTFTSPLDFSAPLPFKTIGQQIAEFDFGFTEVTLATAGRTLRQSSCSGGRSCTSGGDINRAGAAARNELRARGFTNISVQSGVATAFTTIPTNTFRAKLTTV